MQQRNCQHRPREVCASTMHDTCQAKHMESCESELASLTRQARHRGGATLRQADGETLAPDDIAAAAACRSCHRPGRVRTRGKARGSRCGRNAGSGTARVAPCRGGRAPRCALSWAGAGAPDRTAWRPLRRRRLRGCALLRRRLLQQHPRSPSALNQVEWYNRLRKAVFQSCVSEAV